MTQSRTRIGFGILAITTLVLMVATTIGNAINSAEAQGRPDRSTDQAVNNRANFQDAQNTIERNLVGVGVQGNNIAVQAPIQANVCGVTIIGESNTRCNN